MIYSYDVIEELHNSKEMYCMKDKPTKKEPIYEKLAPVIKKICST